MRKFLLLLLFSILAGSVTTFAQNSIAKLKFEEAEEAFAANNYSVSLKKVREVEAILKSQNPKTIYLKIINLAKIGLKDPYANSELMVECNTLCNKYLVEFDNITDLEDKYKSVYNIYESVKKYPTTLTEYNRIDSIIRKSDFYRLNKDSMNALLALEKLLAIKDCGSRDVLYKIGYLYEYGGRGVDIDITEAYKYYKKLHEAGDERGYYIIGLAYRKGIAGYPIDYNRAKEHFELCLAESNQEMGEKKGLWYFINSTINLGNLFFYNLIDYPKALQYYKSALENGVTDGYIYNNLGFLYQKDDIANKDYGLAFSYFKKVVDSNDKDNINYANYMLGKLYENGKGVSQNQNEAISHYLLAAENGHGPAQSSLQALYLIKAKEDRSFKKDAKRWLDIYNANPNKSKY